MSTLLNFFMYCIPNVIRKNLHDTYKNLFSRFIGAQTFKYHRQTHILLLDYTGNQIAGEIINFEFMMRSV